MPCAKAGVTEVLRGISEKTMMDAFDTSGFLQCLAASRYPAVKFGVVPDQPDCVSDNSDLLNSEHLFK